MNTIFQTLVYEREKGHDAVLATMKERWAELVLPFLAPAAGRVG